MKRQRGESAARIAFGAFDSLATLVAVLDADHRVVFANAALEDALGLPRRLVEGTLLVDWFQVPPLKALCSDQVIPRNCR